MHRESPMIPKLPFWCASLELRTGGSPPPVLLLLSPLAFRPSGPHPWQDILTDPPPSDLARCEAARPASMTFSAGNAQTPPRRMSRTILASSRFGFTGFEVRPERNCVNEFLVLGFPRASRHCQRLPMRVGLEGWRVHIGNPNLHRQPTCPMRSHLFTRRP